MSGFYTLGEVKERPGVYHRYENIGPSTEVLNGIGAVVGRSNWGPLNTPVRVTVGTNILTAIGSGSGADVVNEMLQGGCTEVLFARIGTGGTKPSVTISGVTLTAKYPSSRKFSVTVKETLEDPAMKKFILYEGTTVLSQKMFSADGDAGVTEAAALVDALAESKYVDAVLAEGADKIEQVSQEQFTAGSDPDADIASYSAGFSAIEPEFFNVLCVDSSARNVHVMAKSFLDRIYEAGAFPMGCIAEEPTVDLEDRMDHAQGYNDEKLVYVLNGFTDADGKKYSGCMAAARIGGMIAASSANAHLTHQAVTNAASLTEAYTNTQVIKALRSGCLVLSMNAQRQVIIEKAITTLVKLADNQDAGWKKIRRVKTRMELMRRIQKAVDALIGKVDNDSDGQATVIAAMQRVIDAMIGEKKLSAGSVQLDEANKPVGDSAWFVIAVDDLDSMETIYLTYQYRYSA